MRASTLAVFMLLASSVFADLYMHNPRGSNDRLNEANANRNNGARLFDSQNNAKGGYCWGPAMSYYEGSQLSIEWTNQHGCGNSKLWCNMVIQYMCSDSDAEPQDLIRDGTTTNRIPNNAGAASETDDNGDLTYGMHENYQYYKDCQTRNRNLKLFVADRRTEGNLNGRDATRTRQNNNGDRSGYECPEERDYYPYWAPSPWKDIAVLTHDESYCSFYESQSQNVAPRMICQDEDGDLLAPVFENECLGIEGASWVEVPAHNIPAPECTLAPWARDNHLGNGIDGYANTYNWTLPDASIEPCIEDNNCNCVLRLRYNISTSDLDKTDPESLVPDIDGNNPSGDIENGPFLDFNYNDARSPVKDDPIIEGSGFLMQLALDTSQYGRTFQDRSHVFHIRPREDIIPANARVFNLNVRGKRGNIVQAYPAVEYDFVPEILYVRPGDYVHFQWTGCDTNPAGNAGEGTDQTDRSNIVQIENLGANLPASDDWIEANTPLFESPELRKRMAFLDQDPSVCKSWEQLLSENGNNENNAKADTENCMKLNAASQYFDGGAIIMNQTTTEEVGLYYMSSRNNNFSNRGQKGAIFVLNVLPDWAIALVSIGAGLFVVSAGMVGASFYAKSHPHSAIANIFNRM